MKQLNTKAIVLSRTVYGESDRIINVLTPDQGKLTLMTRGVRKVKSRLAGGIELFSINDISYIKGRGEIGTLISARLDKHFIKILSDINRVQIGYELIKLTNKTTEDHPEAEYFYLLEETFTALNNLDIESELIRYWFEARLIKLAGHEPNLIYDYDNEKLNEISRYNFDINNMYFNKSNSGRYREKDIKAMRLIYGDYKLDNLTVVEDLTKQLDNLKQLLSSINSTYLNI